MSPLLIWIIAFSVAEAVIILAASAFPRHANIMVGGLDRILRPYAYRDDGGAP